MGIAPMSGCPCAMSCTLGLESGRATRQMHASVCPIARTRSSYDAGAEVLEPMPSIHEICFGDVYQQPLLFREPFWSCGLPEPLCSAAPSVSRSVPRACLLPCPVCLASSSCLTTRSNSWQCQETHATRGAGATSHATPLASIPAGMRPGCAVPETRRTAKEFLMGRRCHTLLRPHRIISHTTSTRARQACCHAEPLRLTHN